MIRELLFSKKETVASGKLNWPGPPKIKVWSPMYYYTTEFRKVAM